MKPAAPAVRRFSSLQEALEGAIFEQLRIDGGRCRFVYLLHRLGAHGHRGARIVETIDALASAGRLQYVTIRSRQEWQDVDELALFVELTANETGRADGKAGA